MNIIKKVIRKFCLLIAKPTIIFESVPDFSDNTMAVYEELERRGYNKKYYLLWLDKNENIVELQKDKGIKVVSKTSYSLYTKLRLYSSYDRVIVRISCNRFLPKLKDNEVTFYLSHGSPLKDTHKYYVMPEGIDYCFAASPSLESMMARAFQYPQNKFFGLGFPRNDILCNASNLDLQKYFGKFNKYIIWYPTFRQKILNRDITHSKNALPILYDKSLAIKLNECAKDNNVLIIIKPHFAQDVSYITHLGLSNIIFINDSFFSQNAFSSYEFIASSDALLSDYSSIYYDYLLCDKPIGLIWEDIEQYKEKPGLIDNYEYYCKGGEKIYTIEELCNFIKEVAKGVDKLKKERQEICEIMNYSNDGKSTKRVVDFIVDKAGL